MNLLDAEIIRRGLKTAGVDASYLLEVLTTVDSTNRYVKAYDNSSDIIICCAEMQTEGRGRLGKNWYSPFGENIYLSLRFPSPVVSNTLAGLSLVMSLAIVTALRPFNQDRAIQVKWPNDLLWRGKKLCGSLIEVDRVQGSVIIGIGLNVNTDTLQQVLPDKAWCSLYEITGQLQDRNGLIVVLILEVLAYWQKFTEQGFAVFCEEWQQNDALLDKQVSLMQGGQERLGLALGVDATGQLLLQDNQGIVHHLCSGEASFLKEM